ncbi:MAG: hypothetical protein GY705_07375, partial [Bacteroidetes bacterium]|nr:hypothetical protein [Bacteroidota bacterium]
GSDSIRGRGNNDYLSGDSGDDILSGDSGDDNLNGGNGNDILAGGTGDDTLAGQSGNDVYLFNRGDGNDSIETYWNDQDSDTLSFGAGIDADDVSAFSESKLQTAAESVSQYPDPEYFTFIELGDWAYPDVCFGDHISQRVSRIHDRSDPDRSGTLYCYGHRVE